MMYYDFDDLHNFVDYDETETELVTFDGVDYEVSAEYVDDWEALEDFSLSFLDGYETISEIETAIETWLKDNKIRSIGVGEIECEYTKDEEGIDCILNISVELVDDSCTVIVFNYEF